MKPIEGLKRRRPLAALFAVGLVVAGCGDDDDDAGGSPATTAGGDVEVSEEFCAAAQEISDAEDFPTPEQVQRYQEAAPEEIQDEAHTAGDPFIEAGGDPVATFAVFAQDDVEAAVAELSAFEAEHCGIESDESPVGPNEPEEGAAVVEVTAADYAFAMPDTVASGRTSFVLTNEGEEAHFFAVSRIAEGHTMQEALEFEGDPEEAGLVEEVEGGETGLAAPGGEDVEVATVDLEPGTYAAVCFIPNAEGTPHAFLGMAFEFTVS